MSDMAIKVDGLSKQYRIGERESYKALRDVISDAAAFPFRRLRSAFRNGTSPSALGLLPHNRTPKAETLSSFWALDDVSFEVKRGEVVGIIGRNGAGKSTLLKILSRITKPTKGHARIHGRVGSLLEVGTGFHPELTGRENLYLNAAILGMRRAEVAEKFEEIVAFAEVEKFIDTPVKRYSSGMYVRLAFAVAAHMETEILLVDEVLAVGDAQFQKRCLGKMGDVAKQGRTVLFVSHNMVAIQSLCSRAVWIDHGSVAGDGVVSVVSSSYLQAAAVQSTQRYWKDIASAPGNEYFRLSAIRVVDSDGSNQITVSTQFKIEIDYWNLRPETRLNLSLSLFSHEGVCVLATTTIDEPRWDGQRFPQGLFRSVCTMPANLLNDGLYRLLIMAVRDTTTILFSYDNALLFEVQDISTGRGAWFGKWPGTVRPQLAWTTELLHAEASVTG